jgi:hypothetical protein
MTLCHFQKILDFLIEFSVGNTKEGKKRREEKRRALVTDAIIFYHARSSISKSRWKRLPSIWKEFIVFRCQRYKKLKYTI